MTWIKDAAWKLYGAYKRHFLDRIAREMSYTDETLHKALEVYKDYEPPRSYPPAWKVGDIIRFRNFLGPNYPSLPSYFLVVATDMSEMEGFSRVNLIGPHENYEGLIFDLNYELVQSLESQEAD